VKTSRDDADFIAFAKRATAGIDSSGLMLGIWSDDGRGTRQWYAFALQIGSYLLQGKPLILIAPTGSMIPEKLQAAATVIEYYTLGDMASCERATKRALETCGLPVRH
jgi:hypothetical protein